MNPETNMVMLAARRCTLWHHCF